MEFVLMIICIFVNALFPVLLSTAFNAVTAKAVTKTSSVQAGTATGVVTHNNFTDYVGKTAEELYDMGIMDQKTLGVQMELNAFQMQQLMDQQFLNDLQNQQIQNDLQNQQFTDDSMKFSLESVTPFEHGGFNMDIGNSFNSFGCGGGFGMF